MCLLALTGLVMAVSPEARQDLFASLKRAVVVLEATSPSGERLSHGTGFAVRADGLIVTNFHVIEGQRHLAAVFADGTRSEVEGVLLSDAAHDLALLRISAQNLPTIEFGSSAQLQEGATVFTAGNPLGLDFTFNEGSVTALREHGVPEHLGVERAPADRQPLIQLAINAAPGSSGSPVVDAEGKLIGILRAKVGNADFAIRVESLAKQLTDDVVNGKARPLVPFPWWNIAISGVVLGALLFIARRRLGWSPGGIREYEQ